MALATNIVRNLFNGAPGQTQHSPQHINDKSIYIKNTSKYIIFIKYMLNYIF